MYQRKFIAMILGLVLLSVAVFSGCSGKGVSGSAGGATKAGTTVITGKVTLSGSILSSGKAARMKMMYSLPTGKPGSKTALLQASKLAPTTLNDALFASIQADIMAGATVDLYNSDHPDWLFPVASGTTASDGSYSLSSMTNSVNNGSAYTDGDPIPAGHYTLVAHKEAFGQKPLVAVQTLVKNFDGPVPNVDFEVLPSDIPPSVISMLGMKKNKDGTQTWGNATTTLPANAAIQITFSMPMVRETLEAIDIQPSADVPSGKWTLSADWLTATFYPDQGEQFTSGQAYTVTIYGNDDTSGHAQVTNVYGNPIDNTAVGSFKATGADTLSPTVQWNSPTVIQMGTPVDVTQSFRIEANEMLDVNGVTLTGIPSIGVKPGVIYIGKNAAGMYVYEFVLGEPLLLGTSYSLQVTGGKDLAGNPMNVLTGNILTKDAASTPGILCLDVNGNPVTTSGSACYDAAHNPVSPDFQNMEAQVKSVFGRWTRALNDHNLAQFQSLMTGDFYMEYDTSRGISAEDDVNRDGRFSFAEFSNMMAKKGFVQWEYCGTTLTGNVIGSINVVPGTNTADFEFTLTAKNLINSQSCNEAAPKEHLYVTLKFANGTWKIVRASSGIDTRDKAINSLSLVNTHLYQSSGVLISSTSEITDGGQLSAMPDTPTDSTSGLTAKYSWDSVAGASSYVLVIVNARNPRDGLAVAFPTTVTAARSDEYWLAAPDSSPLGGVDVSSKFGFSDNNGTGGTGGTSAPRRGPAGVGGTLSYVDGGRYYWEVIALGSASTVSDDPNFIGGKSASAILKDITATSLLKNFILPGIFKELAVLVRPGTNTTSTPLTFSETVGGYDVGSAYRATLMIATPNVVSSITTSITGNIWLSGSSQSSYPITFDASGLATQTIVLYKGWNEITICDNGNIAATPPLMSLCKKFGILTSGGIEPVISIWDVTDDMGNTLTGDAGNYYMTTSGATKVTISGGVSDSTVNSLEVFLFNEDGAYGSTTASVTNDGSGHYVFTVAMDVYQGNNWIGIQGSGATQWYQTNMGVFTDTGAVWVPPISITDVSAGARTNDYPNSSDWTAAPSVSDNYRVTISGKFKVPMNGTFYTWSDGANANGTVFSLPDGTFTLPVTLYTSDPVNGSWNYISINAYKNDDQGYPVQYAWYGLNILTKTGKPVIKPMIKTINGSLYNPATMGGTFNTSACVATVVGQAETGQVQVSWNSYDGAQNYYESYYVMADGSNSFSVSVPLVGGANSYNYINVYDQYYRQTSVNVVTSGACAYTAPNTSLADVSGNSTGPITGLGNLYDAGATNTTVTLSGVTNRPGATIMAQVWVCNTQQLYQATSSTSPGAGGYAWSISGVKIYGSIFDNYINYGDGYYGYQIDVLSANSQLPPPPPLQILTVTPDSGSAVLSTASCGYTQYTASSAMSVTITGKTAYPGTGNYQDPINGYHRFTTDASGNFTLTNVNVYDGQNYIYIYDTVWNAQTVEVDTTNGIPQAHFVTITSPTLPSDVGWVTGVTTITGTTQDPTLTGFNPTMVRAQIYDSYWGTYTYYSSDATDQLYGYQPLTFSAGNFSFSYDFGTGTNWSQIYVEAYDGSLGVYHYHYIHVNELGNSYGYNKPGTTKRPRDDSRTSIILREFLKHQLMTN